MTKKQKRSEAQKLIIPNYVETSECIKAIQTIKPLLEANKQNWGLQTIFLHDVHESLPMLEGFLKLLDERYKLEL